jgi:hypothetical protein
VAREDEHVIGQFEQAAQTLLQQPRLRVRIARHVQVAAADVAYQERIAGEHAPGLRRPPPPVGKRVGVMRGRVARRRDRGHDGIAELDDVAVCERDVLELDTGPGGHVCGRARLLDERRKARHVVGLYVRLEHRHDRRADRGGRADVLADQLHVRVDDRQLAVRRTAE